MRYAWCCGGIYVNTTSSLNHARPGQTWANERRGTSLTPNTIVKAMNIIVS